MRLAWFFITVIFLVAGLLVGAVTVFAEDKNENSLK
jgi:hypothetical protein